MKESSKPEGPAPTAIAQRKREERSARMAWILDAALDLATEEGLGAVTTTRLAKKLGYTVGAFYRYWESIDELLAALHRRTAELFYESMWQAWIPARDRLADLTKRRTAAVRALSSLVLLPLLYQRLAKEHPKHFELVGQLVTRSWHYIDEAQQEHLNALVLPRITEVIAVFAAAPEAGALSAGDPIVRTMTLWIGVHGALAVRPLAERHPDLVDRDALFLAMVRSLLLGWGASPVDLDKALELAKRAIDKR
ncbi:MAG: helix-turn-helix domain-containing protein [Polyangiaceae bacterium]